MKLGQRLTHINNMFPKGYSHIWDCCCDHGLLGAALLDKQAANMIHFVDIVPALMQQLTTKLERFYPQQTSRQWQVHCSDVSAIPLEQHPQTPLVIIAGVGGDLMIELVNSLCQQHSARNIDFILCPVHHQYELRQQLIKLDCDLIDEKLIEENRRFYEILYVRYGGQKPHKNTNELNNNDTNNNMDERNTRPTMSNDNRISPVGDKIWHSNDPHQQDLAIRYLHKTLEHYSKINKFNPNAASQALEYYRQISIKLRS
ncbi:tRNA (adenine(22)-N(1))-methyltransferase TrmK [Shewanella sp. H8]|uniref:tRNA (adenine(22)-N(1))-methyltransferase n=1 Tax=Shewanella sp. H8 TaxID=3342676 RepID=UPI00331488C1